MDDLHDLYSLTYDKEGSFTTLIWKKQVRSEQLRVINERLVHFIQEHKARKMVNAVHFSHTISPEDQNWLVHDLIPRMYEAGLRYSAVVIPQNIVTRFVVDKVVERLDPETIKTQYFSTIIRAVDWLNQKP